MKKLGFILLAAITLSATVSSLPASAQSVSVGPGGVRVDNGMRDRAYRGRDFRRSRGESRRVIVVPRHRDYDRRRGRTIIIQR